ncbi:MAG: MBL fold metallo-hydrolase [Spirochaetales bacterium]|nr:MBL fold metallo-hydrolase [Spirochaetales bacterium]
MKLFLHFAVVGFSNTYLIGPDEGGDAILIDPGIMNIELLNLIEKNKLNIKHILITHNHNSHMAGIKTLQKIYDFDIYTALPSRIEGEAIEIMDGEIIELGTFKVLPISIQGHSPDSFIFQIDNLLFTGDVLAAGVLGSTPNYKAKVQLVNTLREKVAKMEGNPLIFPGHGPPSTLESELQFNPYFNGQKELVQHVDSFR